jgi:type IV secretory pathway VirB2 component (pilin)
MAGSHDSCPPRPPSDAPVLEPESWRRGRRGKVFRPDDTVEPEFPPERMVRWLSPTGLASSAFRVLLAGIFGLYSDKRELEEVLPKRDPVRDDLSARAELWIDYVADLADGWNPTYAVAWLLAQQKLQLERNVTQRGDVLVMGGDQVYPFATEGQYARRLLAPYQAALPCTPEGESPRLYAIPGNHDWYDGLTTFMRLFCRRQWIGGWQTAQDRSYFAVKLPRGWWLWGLDIQFDFYIDRPQLDFFEALARSEEPADERKIILVTARPSWVHEALEGDKQARNQAKRNLEYFERKIIREHKWRLIVAISGDHHHYARYETDEGPQQKITCGGGGAFLYPTHGLPASVDWPEDDGGREKLYTRAGVYPSPGDSKRLRVRALLVPFTNPSFWALMGVVHLLFAWMIRFGLGADPGSGPQGVRGAGLYDLVVGLVRNPVGLIFAAIVVLGLRTFARMGGWERGVSWVVGIAHALVQVTVVITLIWAFAAPPAFADLATWPFLLFFLPLLGVIGGLVGGLLMGFYLWVSQLAGKHANEAYSSAHIQDYKSFLRLRIAEDGSLTIFPIALDRVPRRWSAVPRGDPQDPWFKPADGEVTARLIEPPIPVGQRE